MRKTGATVTISRIVIQLCLSSSCRSRSEAENKPRHSNVMSLLNKIK